MAACTRTLRGAGKRLTSGTRGAGEVRVEAAEHRVVNRRGKWRAMRVTIQAKSIAAFGVVLVLTGVLGLVAVSRVGSVYRVATAVGHDGVASETSVATIGQVMNKFRKDQIHYMVVT